MAAVWHTPQAHQYFPPATYNDNDFPNLFAVNDVQYLDPMILDASQITADESSSPALSQENTRPSSVASSSTFTAVNSQHNDKDSMFMNPFEDRFRGPEAVVPKHEDSPKAGVKAKSASTHHRPKRRPRKVEQAEPGSARAVYLEKNRNAASKCRNKQKKHEEELIELARVAERSNKMLKAEVDSLWRDLTGLMDILGQHKDCLDERLAAYLQRGADKLVMVGKSQQDGSPAASGKFGSLLVEGHHTPQRVAV